MRIAIDTNVLAYAEGVNDSDRQARADAILIVLKRHELVIPVQVAGELYRVLTRKVKMSALQARGRVAVWQDACAHQPSSTPATMNAAFDLSANHGLDIWDALIVNAAADAGSRMLLSEDMTDGFVWRGVMIVDPFRVQPHPLLADLLNTRYP